MELEALRKPMRADSTMTTALTGFLEQKNSRISTAALRKLATR